MLRNGGKAAKVDSDAKGDVHVEDKDSEDEAPTSLSWSSRSTMQIVSIFTQQRSPNHTHAAHTPRSHVMCDWP
jgi:hypothetical protein